MDLRQLRTLKDITNLVYQRDLAELNPVLKREALLRQQLTKLEHQATEGRSATQALEAMRPLGADVLWEKWLARNRQDINTQLAQVLAEKERTMSILRASYGRAQVASQLVEQELSNARLNKDRAGNSGVPNQPTQKK